MRHPLSPEELQAKIKLIEPISRGFDYVSDHVVITDPNGTILYANRAVKDHTGFDPEECIGKNPADLWGGNNLPETYSVMWDTIKNQKKPWTGEIENRKKDGTEYWQEVHITPILDANADVMAFIGYEPEVTERKHQEEIEHKMRDFLVGRELRMIDLKDEVQRLRKLLGEDKE